MYRFIIQSICCWNLVVPLMSYFWQSVLLFCYWWHHQCWCLSHDQTFFILMLLKKPFYALFFFLFRIWIKNTKCQNRLLIDVNFYYVNIDTENRTIFSSFLVYLSICIWCFPILLLLLSTVFSVVVVVRYICFHWP